MSEDDSTKGIAPAELVIGSTPAFSNQETYEIIDANTGDVKSGQFFLDTRVVVESIKKPFWETQLKVQPDGQLVTFDDASSNAFYDMGEIFPLWDLDIDPNGDMASRFHAALLQSIRSGIAPDEIEEAVQRLLQEMQDAEIIP